MQLREAVRTLIEALPEFPERQRLQQTAAQVDAALGLDAGLPPTPRLWEKGGKPILPRTLQQVEASNQIFDLCDLVKVTVEGYPASHPLVLAAVTARRNAAKGEEESPVLQVENNDEPSMVDEYAEAVAIALEVSSSLTADLKLRRELLEGICLFEVGLQLQSGGALAEDVCHELVSAFKREAEKAVDDVLNRHGKLVESFDIAAGTETRMKQARVLPPAAMAHESGREMQRQLLAWIDLNCSKQQLMGQTSVHGSTLSLLLRSDTTSSILDASQLESIAHAVAASGCRDISEGAPYNVLLWLVDASEKEGFAALRDSSKEWKHSLQQALAHEAWFKWHQALWSGAVSIEPDFTYKSPLQAPEWWKRVSGPMLLHMSSLTAHALAITASPKVPISDRGLKLLQLQLAGRHLRGVARDVAGGNDNIADAEVRSAIIITAATLEAHLQDLPADVLVAAAIERLGQDPHPVALLRDASGILEVLNKAVLESSHRILREVWPLALFPALQLLLTHRSILAESPAGKKI